MNDDDLKDLLEIRCQYPFDAQVLPASEVAKVDMKVCCDRGPIPDEIIREFRAQRAYDDIISDKGTLPDAEGALRQEIKKLEQERDAYIAFLNEMIFRPLIHFDKRTDAQHIATSIAEGIKDGTIDCEASIQEVWYDECPRGKKGPYYAIRANYVLHTKK